MSLYVTPLAKANTFVFVPWSGDGVIATIADYEGNRYLYADAGVTLPTSAVASYQLAVLTVDLIKQITPYIAALPDALMGNNTVYKTSDKSVLTIPKWANAPIGYTNQVPREFDSWDGNLWITDAVLRNKTLKRRKLVEINAAFEVAMLSVRVDYTESEIMSWSKQETEAKSWLLNNNHPTPLLDLIASARSLDKATLINKVILKSDQYAYATGVAVGRRQYLEDCIALIAVGQESKLDQIKF